MAWMFNAATGRFENKPAPRQGGPRPPRNNTATKPGNSNPPAPDQTPNATNPNRAQGPPGPGGQGYPLKTNPTKPAASNVQAGPPAPAWMNIDSGLQAIEDEAAAYREANGESPPASWYEIKMIPIQIAINDRERAIKESSDRAKKAAEDKIAAARGAAARAAAEQERLRALRAGRQAEADLRRESERIKQDAMSRIANLYDPMESRTKGELETALKDVAAAFDNAGAQVRGAGEEFLKSFRPTEAYTDLPIAQYDVADNPLLAALQQQGAGTGQVEAATSLARQSAEQASSLEKWAATQLGTSQKNYEEAMRRASTGGVTSALQDLASRQVQVRSGIESDYRKILDDLARERAGAEADTGSAYDEAIAAANQIRSETTAKFTKPKQGPRQKPKQPKEQPAPNRKPQNTTGKGNKNKPKF